MSKCSLAIVAVLAAGACGGGDDKSKADDQSIVKTAPADTPDLNGAPGKPEGDPLKRVAVKFARAVGAKNYRVACQTRTPAEREALAKAKGSCARGLAEIAGSPSGKNFDRLGDAVVIYVEKSGNTANVGVGDPETALVYERLRARRIQGRWLIVPG